MSFLIEGEKVVMKVHASRLTHYKSYLIALVLLAIPAALYYFSVRLPVPQAYSGYVFVAPAAVAILLVLIAEISVRRSTSYITNFRVIISKGGLRSSLDSCTYDKMVNVRVVQTLAQRILRIGNVDIQLATTQKSEILFQHVSNPSKVEKTIYNMIERSKSQFQAPQAQTPAQPSSGEHAEDDRGK